MAVRYYDDAIKAKLNKWIPETSQLRVFMSDDLENIVKTRADDKNDSPIQLPFIALSRSKDIELQLNIKESRSFDGLKVAGNEIQTAQLNRIPISINYQLDIYTKTVEDGDEYLRNFLFKLINNPLIHIDIPYNGSTFKHVAYIRVLSSVSNTTEIPQHLYMGQFNRWSIQFELQDAFLFSIPYRQNWGIEEAYLEIHEDEVDSIDNYVTEKLDLPPDEN